MARLDPAARERFDSLASELDIVPPLSPDGRLDTRALSQGQRKRVALCFALSEFKPIHFFDEWTADQDPEFRVYFYEKFLPRLRASGKTIFVVSHDDRYFHTADLLVKLDAGHVQSVRRREGIASLPNPATGPAPWGTDGDRLARIIDGAEHRSG